MTNPDIAILRAMVAGAYDLQKLRIQAGLRLCANFRAKLGAIGEIDDDSEEAEQERERAINLIKADYARLTDGIISPKGRINMAKLNFTGAALISSHAEYSLVDSYVALERQEAKQFRDLTNQLELIPIYTNYLRDVRGVGPAMAGVLIAYFDIYRAKHVSSFWQFAGLDVAPDGAGRSRREEHLIERKYVDRHGETKTRKSVTYDPFVKTKLMGVLAASFLRSNSPWRQVYDGYKHRIQTDPSREKCTVGQWKKTYKANPEQARKLWPPGRIHKAASRYMVKQFLADFYKTWRALEGLPIDPPYSEAKQGMKPHAAA